MGFSLAGKTVEVSHQMAKAETKQKILKAQAMRFIDAIGLDGIQTWTLQEMVDKMGHRG